MAFAKRWVPFASGNAKEHKVEGFPIRWQINRLITSTIPIFLIISLLSLNMRPFK